MEKQAIRQIGRYQILDVIGRGGMGVVYRAIDTTIDRRVAIKMLLGGGEEDKDNLLARFHREARSTANLQHQNIVTVYALDDFDGFPYMVMEYLEGKSMAEMINSREQIPLVDKLGLVCQVCDGLQYAHDRNVIHRDIKPANILVLKDGVAKIVDFGIARVGQNESLTRTGQIIGSVYYMSPEQISGALLDNRADIYSAGVMLYQFLTGDLPFRASETDPQATFIKILNDPVPSLGKYLNDFPATLDEILAKAMAKNVDDRYQAAEDLGYDLSRLQESLKREMTDEFLAQANVAIENKDWESARQKLQEILRFDRRNSKANELFQSVRQELQRQQKSIQIDQLRSQAEMALSAGQSEEAFACIEQARRLDPNDEELNRLSRSIKDQIERARELVDALRRGQAALYAGDLDEAGLAIYHALQIDSGNTEARTLESLVRKELEDRTRRAKFQGFIDEARREISSRDFVSALRSLEKAQTIDPADSNIRELLNWAARGYEQEKLRNELRKYTDEIGRLLAENRFSDALAACANALQHFPDDPPLQKLHELAKRQHNLVEHRRAVDEASAKARRLVEEEKSEEAIEILEAALQAFPGEANLQTLLAITRSEAERKLQEKEEREKQVSTLTTKPIYSNSVNDGRRIALERVKAFQTGLTRRLSVSQLSDLAAQAQDAAKLGELNDREMALLAAALSEFEVYSGKRGRDYADLEELRSSISKAKNSTEVDSLLDRARLISEQHPKDEEIRFLFESIHSLAEENKRKREEVGVQITALLRSIESNQNLVELLDIQKQVQSVSEFWSSDPYIRSLVDQVAFHIDEVQKSRDQVLQELGRLAQSIETARSAGQIRFLQEQAKMLAADQQDAEVLKAIGRLEHIAEGWLEALGKTVAGLTEELSEISGARSLAEVERHEALANNILEKGAGLEEAADLMRRIQRSVEERNKEYKRIHISLEQLIANSAAAGLAELDSIQARQQILINKYPDDAPLKALERQLETSVLKRREVIAELASSEQIYEVTEDAELAIEVTTSTGATASQTITKEREPVTAAASPKTKSRLITRIFLPAAGAVIALGLVAFVVAPRAVYIQAVPEGAVITSEDQECHSPCTLKLRAGTHTLTASRDGFQSLHTTIDVFYFQTPPPVLTLAKAVEEIPNSSSTQGSQKELVAAKNARILVRTSTPAAFVFADGSASPVGQTDASGSYQLVTSAGTHQIKVQKFGYDEAQAQTISAKTDEQVLVSFNLRQLPQSNVVTQPSVNPKLPAAAANAVKAAPAQPSTPVAPIQTYVVIQAPAGAEIHIDQQATGHSTGGPLKSAVEPGQRTIEVFLQGYKPWKQSVTADAGKQTEVAVNLSPVPVVAAAPNTAAPKPQSGVSDEDRKQIKQLLDKYANAIVRRDLKQLHEAWPDIPKNQLEVLKSLGKDHKGVSLSIAVDKVSILEGSEDAVVKCKQVLQYDGKTSEDNVTFYLGKLSTGWIINQIPRSN
jgi:eukaryotic-like serine/threonine-protein kinase